jgi:signal transduction histidine kinase
MERLVSICGMDVHVTQGVTKIFETIGSGLGSVFKAVKSAFAGLRDRLSRLGLSGKLLLITIAFATIVEVLIFLPTIASYRIDWLQDRIGYSYVSALAADAAPGGNVPPSLRNELLRTALVRTVAIRRDGRRRMVLPPVMELSVDATYDLRPPLDDSLSARFWLRVKQIKDALYVYFTNEDRNLRIIGLLGPRRDDIIEVVLPEAPLKRAMQDNAWNIFSLSIIISFLLAALVYWALSTLLIRPLTRLTRNMLHFSENPEDPERIIKPTGRHDEIGTAEHELQQMQQQLAQLLHQKTRLAQLGLAVSKVNHDLRNMLGNAQLISDRLTAIPDPTVQRFAPKLIASLDRAINFCNDTLKFGRTREAQPRRELFRLQPLLDEVADSFGLPSDDGVGWAFDLDENLRIDADRDHLFRVLSNLVRNAVQAIESLDDEIGGTVTVRAWREGRKVSIEVSDDGPGLPETARKHLFKAFQGSTRAGGTGLGLTIAAELVGAHNGTIRLLDTEKGATFLIEIPDRSVS